MQFRKTFLLFIIGSSLLSGCNNEPKKMLVANSDYLLTGEIAENNLFFTPTYEEFSNLYNSNLNYIVYFTDEGCSACIYFKPIIEQYIKETHQLVVTVGGSDKAKIEQEYKSKFFNDSDILTPAIFVKENDDNIYKVDYSSYMKTYGVFKNHLESRYQTAKYAYFSGEITAKSWINREFTYLEFNANDTFKNMVSPLLISSQKDVLISYKTDVNYVRIICRNDKGEFYTKAELEINDQTNLESIKNFF